MIIRCVVLVNRRWKGVVRSVRKGGVSGRVVADLRGGQLVSPAMNSWHSSGNF
jgi:hypothetical protein